jgi:ribosomal protein S18 acetylase RimI-like enzyme
MTLPEKPGIVWRAPSPADAEALVAHTRRINEEEHLHFVPGPTFFRWVMAQAEMDPETDWRVAVDGDGSIVADGGAWIHITDEGGRVFIWSETGPRHHDLEPGLLAWSHDRAVEALEATPEGLPRTIRLPSEEHRVRHRAVFEAAGFEVGRSFVTMSRSLENLSEARPLPEEIRAVPWEPGLSEGARLANNASFADHWGSLPVGPEQWRTHYVESEAFRPDLSFLALSKGEVIAICLCEVDQESNADKGVAEIYIERVGTIREHRGVGIASHLVVRSMEAAAAAGLKRAALEVDEISHTGATEVYRRLGFEVESRTVHYLREL